MNKTLLIIGIVITGISLLAITIFSLSNTVLKRINKEKEAAKTVEQKQHDKTVKRVLKNSKKIIKKINKRLVENYVAVYIVSAVTLTGGAALTTVSAVNVVNENNASSSSEPAPEPEPEPEPASSSTYTVTWKNYDGTVLKTDESIVEGTTPTYQGVGPSKAPTTTINYVFDGWEPAITPVSSDVTYTAKFKEETRLYTVQWLNLDDSLIREDKYIYQAMPENDDTPTYGPDAQYEYEFVGWEPAIAPVTEDTYYKASYNTSDRTYTVRWLDDDISHVFEVDTFVEYGSTPDYNGETPEKEETESTTYEFIGWSPLPSPVVSDIDYVAMYKETTKVYTVTWLDDDSTLLGITYVEHGHPAIYDGDDPYKAGFIFDGWEPDTVMVTGDCTFIACYREAEEYYTLTIHNPYIVDTPQMALIEGTIIASEDLPALRGLFADPNDDHHKADQFYIDELKTEPLDINTPLMSNYDVYATYCYEYRVTYKTDDDEDGVYTEVDYEDVLKDECADGNVSGYENYEWYYESDPTVKYDFSTPITDDVVLIGIEKSNNSINL